MYQDGAARHGDDRRPTAIRTSSSCIDDRQGCLQQAGMIDMLSKRSKTVVGLFAAIWTALSVWLAIDSGIAPQLRSWSYPVVPGRITGSKVKDFQDEDGVFYSPSVTFRYEVAGRAYVGTRYRYVNVSTTNRQRVERIVAALPPGQIVEVHYRPGKPADAVVDTSFADHDALAIAWLTTVILTTSFAYISLYRMWRWPEPSFARSVKLAPEGYRIVLPESRDWGIVMVVVWVASILATILCTMVVLSDLLMSGKWLAAIYAGITFCVGPIGGAVAWTLRARGRYDIYLDVTCGTLRARQPGCAEQWLIIDLAGISAIEVVTQSMFTGPWYSLKVTFRTAENSEPRQTEFCWSPYATFVNDFANWLRGLAAGRMLPPETTVPNSI